MDNTGTVVEREDQGRINQFANQVARRNELRDDIETKEVGMRCGRSWQAVAVCSSREHICTACTSLSTIVCSVEVAAELG